MAKLFKVTGRGGKKSRCWYGKVKSGSRWQRVILFTDKVASERRLRDLQSDADRSEAGVTSEAIKRLSLPIGDLAKEYISSLRVQRKDPDHVRISRWMLDKLIELGDWQTFRDISRESMERVLDSLEKQEKTASYRNKFVARAKAFVRWALPESWPSPLAKLKRISEKGAKRNRERRAAEAVELARLLVLDIPDHRRLAYVLAALNGLRRNEAEDLTWDQVRLTAAIPFVRLTQKQGEALDHIPLHPYVVRLLNERMPGMAAVKVLPSVPDVQTLKKDWGRAQVAFKDAQGRRLDYHALRHTFQTLLDLTGCSRATKKKLMRHAADDVTDGYAHAELAEMRTALLRLPSPSTPQWDTAAKTGTDGRSDDEGKGADHQSDQTSFTKGQSGAQTGTKPAGRQSSASRSLTINFARRTAETSQNQAECLITANCADNVSSPRPSTQVD